MDNLETYLPAPLSEQEKQQIESAFLWIRENAPPEVQEAVRLNFEVTAEALMRVTERMQEMFVHLKRGRSK